MDNPINFPSTDEFNKLSDDEKRESMRNIIHRILEDGQAKAVLFNPVENQSYSLENMIESLGEERLISLLVQAMENGDMNPQRFSKDELNAAIERKKNGTATPKDEQMIELLTNLNRQNEVISLNETLTTILVDLIEFVQNDRDYSVTIGDVLATINLLSTITCTFTEGSSLEKYQQLGPTAIHHMAKEMGQDIIDTWKNTCTEVPDDYMMLCALLEAAQIYANNIKFCNVDTYKKILANVLCDICEEECDCCHDECDGDCHCESDNGSNKDFKQSNMTQPKTYSSTDQNMRDMLKD